MASRGDDELAVLVWHYHDDDVAGPDATVHLELTGLPRGTPVVTHFRIDEQHSNSYAAWRRKGSPIAPDKAAWDELSAAAQLSTVAEPAEVRVKGGKAQLSFQLPRQGVTLLVFALPH
jgi:xylan 1,4-beta-xylosidase